MTKNEYLQCLEKIAADETSISNTAKKIKDAYIENKVNDTKKMALRVGAGAVGTALDMRRGKSLPQAIARGGMAGMAMGDISGSAIFPLMSLRKEHKKEFGESPDAKSIAKVMAANVIPTTALWGGLYGVRKGVQKRNEIATKLGDNIEKIRDNSKGLSSHIKYYKEPLNVIESGAGKVYSDINGSLSGIRQGVMGSAMSFAPLGAAQLLTEIPAVAATPRSIVQSKKRELSRGAGSHSKSDNTQG